MISPVSLWQEVKSQRKYLSDLQKAEQYFEAQKEAIRAIKDTQGYKEMRMYWMREREASIERLKTAKGSDLHDAQARLTVSQSFLDFLDNLLS